LTHEEQQFRVETGDLLWQPLDGNELAASVAARSALVDAIAARDADRARTLAEDNILADTRRLVRLRIQLYSMEGAT
jgi:DNA-binding GntR family transcriptional regulator